MSKVAEDKENKYKRWCIATVLILCMGIVSIAVLVVVIDPYWHFHSPTKGISYRLGNGRYMNDGILRNYEYDSVIIGTSMCENFKPSQWESMTGEKTVKTPLFGATYKEIHDTLERAFSYKSNVQTVIWGLDYNLLTSEWNRNKYESYPDYLYDNTIWNDGDYLWNKTVLFRGVLPDVAYTLRNRASADFDTYSSWQAPNGREAVLTSFTPGSGKAEQILMAQDIRKRTEDNVINNVEDIIKNNPNTQFYLFFTPYSIAYWDSVYHGGNINVQIEATRIFVEHLLPYENVKIFSFFDNTDMICNLDNYADAGHYIDKINEQLLQWMAKDSYRWTEDTYTQKLEEMRQFYSEFDYEGYWQ